VLVVVDSNVEAQRRGIGVKELKAEARASGARGVDELRVKRLL